MATYDYQCTSCGHTFEQMKKISERDIIQLDVCPGCYTVGQITRMIGSPMIAYSVTVAGGYGTVTNEWKDVLKKVHSAPGAKPGFSSFL